MRLADRDWVELPALREQDSSVACSAKYPLVILPEVLSVNVVELDWSVHARLFFVAVE